MSKTYYEPEIKFSVATDDPDGLYVSVVVGVRKPTEKNVTAAMHEVAARVQAAAKEALEEVGQGLQMPTSVLEEAMENAFLEALRKYNEEVARQAMEVALKGKGRDSESQ